MDVSTEGSRDGISSSSRVQAYSDAVFSIVATIMILPIAHTKIPENERLSDNIIKMWPKLTIYIASFLIVSGIWSSHTWIFDSISHSDETILLLNLMLLMASTFLPFAFTLIGTFPGTSPDNSADGYLPTLLMCGSLLIVFSMQLAIIHYSFRKNSKVLKQEVLESAEKLQRRNVMMWSCFIPVCVVTLAAIVASFSVAWGNMFLLGLLFTAPLRKLGYWIYGIYKGRNNEEISLTRQQNKLLLSERLSKERIEAFSDGVFAIVATLIILDISEEAVPDDKDVEAHGSVAKALSKDWPIFLAYAATFVTVGLLWYVHHSFIHYIKRFTRTMGFFNSLCLLCIGFSPLAFKLTSQFTKDIELHLNNELTAIQFNTATLSLASISQVILWVVALIHKDGLVEQEAHYGGSDHLYTTIKLAIYPLLSLFIFFMSFDSVSMTIEAFHGLQLGAPLLFILLRFLYPKLHKLCTRKHNPLVNHEYVQEESMPQPQELASHSSEDPTGDL